MENEEETPVETPATESVESTDSVAQDPEIPVL